MTSDKPANGDYSVVIQIMVWFLLTIAILAYLARLGTKLVVMRTFHHADDFFVSISLIFSIGQSAAVAIAAINGLGNPINRNTYDRLATMEKAQYAGQMLWILSLCSSRLAYLCLLRNVTPKQGQRNMIKLAFIIVCAWATISVVTFAFQCHVPATWNYLQPRCINRGAWFISLESLNAVVDAGLIALPTRFIMILHAQRGKKLQAISLFWLRAAVVAASITDAVLWSRVSTARDQSREAWAVVICSETVQALRIITVSGLYLKPFMQMLQSGFLRVDDMQRRGSTPVHDDGDDDAKDGTKPTLGVLSEISAERGPENVWDAECHGSRANIILTERSWTIESGPREEDCSERPETSPHGDGS